MVLNQGFSNCGPGTARVPQWGCEGVHDKGSGKNDVFFFLNIKMYITKQYK